MLSGLRGKVVLLTFLDPVCVTDCPLIAQEFRQAGQLLGADNRRVELVAVNLNPIYSQLDYIRAFDRAEGLDTVPNWHFLTSDQARLRQVWRAYGVASQVLQAGAMLGHTDVAFVVDQRGHLVQELNFDPGPVTPVTIVLRRPAGRRGEPDPGTGMTRARRAAAGLALAIAVAGCGSGAERPAAPHPPKPVPLSLATSLTSAGTAWATIPMGAPSGPNQFWQLFTLAAPAAAGR